MNVRLPVVEAKSSLRSDGSRDYVHPADVRGRFTRRRYVSFAALIALWAALPWIEVGGHPAVFLDVMRRRFYLFGATFNAQDFWLVFFLLSGVGFALVVVTALYGRVWCGYACPQTVFLEGVFRRVERLIEGPREERIRRKRGKLTFDTLWRRALKHAVFFLLALAIAHIVLSYFVSLPAMFEMVRGAPSEHLEAFAWALSLTAILYFDFAWFREQLCLVICPYGRLQSALTDDDTLVIGYDVKRGEPRGKVGTTGAGDCVGCNRCVVVCPTGIDIRNGLQLDCIGCASCVDACDEVMHKLGRAPGLVRYDSLNGLFGKTRRLLRPRLALYAVLGAVGLAVATFAFGSRTTFEANLLRQRSTPYVIADGRVRNDYEIHLVNKRPEAAHFVLAGEGGGALEYVIALPELDVPSFGSRTIPVFAFASVAAARTEKTARLTIRAGDGETKSVEASFLAPR